MKSKFRHVALFGKYHASVTGGALESSRKVLDDVARLVKDFPPRRHSSEQGEQVRGLSVRLSLNRQGASAELQLGEAAKFYPSDAALASWMAQADRGLVQVVYE